MTLHCLYRPPAELGTAGFGEALAESDALLLLGPAVTAAEPGEALAALPGNVAVYALEEDLRSLGITALAPRVASVDYDGWLRLSESHPLQCLWD
jgi:sulfur relay protein TusB/DsrH